MCVLQVQNICFFFAQTLKGICVAYMRLSNIYFKKMWHSYIYIYLYVYIYIHIC